jgi:hypothetical protein
MVEKLMNVFFLGTHKKCSAKRSAWLSITLNITRLKKEIDSRLLLSTNGGTFCIRTGVVENLFMILHGCILKTPLVMEFQTPKV